MEDIPPFTGFSKAGLQFLADLQENNNREWFNEQKSDYLEFLMKPAQSFVKILGGRLEETFPEIEYDTSTNGRGSIMRQNRDVRFSKDKSPYNTRLRMFFWEGAGKKMENPGFFLGFDAKSAIMHSGIYRFSKQKLEKYRKAVCDEGTAKLLTKAIQELNKQKVYEVGGSHYKKIPRGYEVTHPYSNLLLHNGLHVTTTKIPMTSLTKPKLVDVVYDHCMNMAPIHQWIVSNLA